MLEIDSITCDRGPVDAVRLLIPEVANKTKMSTFDSSFLCGLLKKHMPHKIVEVGVSGGETSAIIMQCMKELDYEYELFSVELLEHVHDEPDKPAGYMGTKAAELLGKTDWELLLGGVLPDHLDRIGPQIDFLMLDTTHALPGELLDFLAALPSLAPGAVVCMHDVRQNFKRWETSDSIATTALLSCVVADKIICSDSRRSHGYPNIAAFTINDRTREYAANVALALVMSWHYMPERAHLGSYLRVIERSYGPEVSWIVAHAIELNADRFEQRPSGAKAYSVVRTPSRDAGLAGSAAGQAASDRAASRIGMRRLLDRIRRRAGGGVS